MGKSPVLKLAAVLILFDQAVPVPVHLLGAHLQAYAELQPAVNTLRLCNRHGHGDHAAISRLPVELITAIESYIIEDKRQELRIE